MSAPERRRWRGLAVNPRADEPEPPGPWVDAERCAVCDELYATSTFGVDFADGVQRLRAAAGGFESGGGYRSRRPVLWFMRLIKLERWYERHFECGRDEGEPVLGADGILRLNGFELF